VGVGFVFIIYLVAIAVVVLPCMLICAASGRYLARHAKRKVRKKFTRAGAIIPVLGGLYLVAFIVLMAIFGSATGRDFGFGDGFDIPLNNGYHWSAIDITEVAAVYDLNDSRVAGSLGSYSIPSGYPTAFYNVLSLQQHGDWLAGSFLLTLDRSKFDMNWKPDHWFLFNTKTHERIDAQDQASLKTIAAEHGFSLHLESSPDFYSHHRYGWYDGIAALLLFMPGVFAVAWIYKKARYLLRETQENAGPDPILTT
jgi:hypothetical protein